MSLSPEELSAATQAIETHQRLLIIPHANIDPDGMSSALACYELFQSLGKDVTVICPDSPPESLKFLPGFEKLQQNIDEAQKFVVTVNLDEGVEVDKLRYSVEDQKVNIIVVPKKGRIHPQNVVLSEGEQKYDLIVVVDSADLALLGSIYTDHIDLFSNVPILNIDHHISNTRFGQLALIDPTASSATEVLYHWFLQNPAWRDRLTPDIATLLLTGLITDTRSFQNPNTTPRSLEVAAELLEMGARQQEIIKNVYKTKPLSTLKIWGRALNRIQIDEQAGIVWSAISKEDLVEMEAASRETSGILDELISTVPDADVYILFTELEEGGMKASMRSSSAIDVSSLAAREFGGGGHPRAAGFRVVSFDNFQLQVLDCVRRLKDGMHRQRVEVQDSSPARADVPASDASVPVREESQISSFKKEEKPATPPPESGNKEVDVAKDMRNGDGPDTDGAMDIVQQLT